MMNGWFTIVETDDGWHVTIDGGNGETVFWTENYADQATAREAIDFVRQLAAAEPPVIRFTGGTSSG